VSVDVSDARDVRDVRDVGDVSDVSDVSVAGVSRHAHRKESPPVGTVADWLERLEPTPPAALHVRLRELLADAAARPASEVPSACLEAGEQRLRTLLSERATDRASALDLLAVDALVSYAFEAAAETPEVLEQLAEASMVRIAEIPEAT
jgi:hypothetical protein